MIASECVAVIQKPAGYRNTRYTTFHAVIVSAQNNLSQSQHQLPLVIAVGGTEHTKSVGCVAWLCLILSLYNRYIIIKLNEPGGVHGGPLNTHGAYHVTCVRALRNSPNIVIVALLHHAAVCGGSQWLSGPLLGRVRLGYGRAGHTQGAKWSQRGKRPKTAVPRMIRF